MYFDHRVYRTHPGRAGAHMEMYQKYGYEVQTETLGQPVLYALAEAGNLDTFVHIWAYDDLEERAEKREKLVADPRWTEFRNHYTAAGNLVHQQNSILVSAPFFNLKR